MKPPRNIMEPEAVDLDQAGRTAAFQDDAMRHYMARKIDLQRRQFGLQVPPDPRALLLPQTTSKQAATTPTSPNNNSTASSKKRKLHVTFSKGVKEGDDYSTTTTTTSRRNKKRKKKGAINSIVNRLQQRHGRGHCKRRRPERQKRSHANKEQDVVANNCKFSNSTVVKHGGDRQVLKEIQGQSASSLEKTPRATDRDSAASLVQSTDGSQVVVVVDPPPTCQEQTAEPSTLLPFPADQDDDDDNDAAADEILGIHKNNNKQLKQTPHATSSSLRPSPQMRRDRPDLFLLGVVVQVNGYTNPDTETLQRLLHRHGGDLEKYETSRITHIIAEHLSTAKANIYKKMRRPIPVVKPSWITDSVQSMRLLPHGAYLIDEVKNQDVASVKNFFTAAPPKDTPAAAKTIENQTSESSSHPSLVSAGRLFQEAGNSDARVSNADDPTSNMEIQQKHAVHACPSSDKAELLAPNANSVGADKGDSVDSPMAKRQPTPVISHPANMSGKTDDKFINGQIRSTGSDPHFLDSFFRNSRLSFIGSYKQRIQESPKKQAGRADCGGPKKRFVFHCDMDCFFAAVVLRHYPEHQNKPVAISHIGKPGKEPAPSDSYQPKKNSSSECATCNYEARKFGIKKGMFLGRALELCPTLIVLPYDFEGYEEVSEQVAVILQTVAAAYDGEVEQVSCDESYVELFFPADDELSDPNRCAGEVANAIRREILDTTRCTATIGVGKNKLLSKLATDRVKPNGSFVVRNHTELLRNLKLRDLHGIGYRTAPKLTGEGLVSVQDVWDLGESAENELCRILGPGLGKKIFDFCNGVDERPVKAAERKTIGAECNYGVRFDGPYGVDYMIEGLSREIEKRMASVGVRGSRVTLKMKQRKQGAKAPPKFLGHGSCHNLSKSLEVAAGPTRDWKVISELGKTIFAELNVSKDDVRGMGIVLSKLDTTSKEAARDGRTNQSITNWFSSRTNPSAHSTEPAASSNATKAGEDRKDECVPLLLREAEGPSELARGGHTSCCADLSAQNPSFSQIEPSILGALPQDIQDELEGKADRMSTSKNLEEEDDDQSNGGASGFGQSDDLSHNSLDDQANRSEDYNQNDQPIASPRSEQSFGDVALPPMSQIRLSQVEALPSPLRRQINTKIAKHNSVADDAKKSSKKKIVPTNTFTSSTTRLRQVSVKRMLKLAAFKSGNAEPQGVEGGNAISVKELECLPLEMQLQVANNDNCLLGNLTTPANKRGRTSLPSRKTSSTHHVLQPNRNTKAAPTAVARRSLQMETEVSNDRLKQKGRVQSGNPSSEGQLDLCDDGCEDNHQEGGHDAGPSDFFQDNVAPLALFMDENPADDGDALNQVLDFLCLCVRERRLYDAVLLLRNIKNRGDSWSSLSYGHLCLAVDDACDQVEGYRLDRQGLGL